MPRVAYNGFAGPSYTTASQNVDAEQCINFYPEHSESPNAKAPIALLPTPGFALFAMFGTTGGRGMLTQNGRLFVVVGSGFYEVSSDGGVTLWGTVTQDTNPATMATNGIAGNQVVIASGGFLSCFDLGTSVFTANITTGTIAGFIDDYFVALDVPTSTLKWSALGDGTTWPSINVAQRNTTGDRWQSMIVSHGQIWLPGGQRTDVWQDVGQLDQPFQPFQGSLIDYGIAAASSIASLDNSPIWLGGSEVGIGIVYRFDGYAPTRISNFAVEHAIQSYSTISDAVAWTYQQDGHSFYVLNFPSQGISWVYDAATSQWHTRGAWDSGAMSYVAYRAQAHAFAFGRHLVQDRVTGDLYTMSLDSFTEIGGGVIRRVRRAPYVVNMRQSVVFDELEIDLEAGLGTQDWPTVTPQVMLRMSRDGAKTWPVVRQASAGRIGDYGHRVRFQMLGSGRNTVFEMVVSDGVPWRIAGAYLRLRPGVH